MTAKTTAIIAGVLGFFSVALGAFAAHGLKNRLDERMMEVFRTGVEYQFLHALALLALAVWMAQRPLPLLQYAAWAFVVGVIIFSGSLYLLVGTGVRTWGAVTPLGGTSFLVGWFLVTLAAIKS